MTSIISPWTSQAPTASLSSLGTLQPFTSRRRLIGSRYISDDHQSQQPVDCTISPAMTTPARSMRLVTPLTRSQASFLQPRYASLVKPAFSTTQLSPLSRRFTSPAAPRLASPAAASHSSASHDSHGHHGSAEDRGPPDYGLHLHEPSRWHVLGSKVFGQPHFYCTVYKTAHTHQRNYNRVSHPSSSLLCCRAAGGLLWFWLLYRLKNDWRYYFVSPTEPQQTHTAPHAHTLLHCNSAPQQHTASTATVAVLIHGLRCCGRAAVALCVVLGQSFRCTRRWKRTQRAQGRAPLSRVGAVQSRLGTG